jgi:hypothetical protein
MMEGRSAAQWHGLPYCFATLIVGPLLQSVRRTNAGKVSIDGGTKNTAQWHAGCSCPGSVRGK